MKPKTFLFLFISFVLWSMAGHAEAKFVKKPINDQRLIPASLLRWPLTGSPYAILVDKSQQKVLVYSRNNLFDPVKVYACSTGENKGPKRKQNDSRTPEGIYFFTHSYIKRELTPIYGIRAFPIDYPNPLDEKEGRSGYGIWFHGTNKPLKPYDSNGCIVLKDRDIDDLASHIQLFKTPVIISAKLELQHPSETRAHARELERIVEEWKSSWQGKQIDRYMAFYSPKFSSGGKNWEDWRSYKNRLANKYGEIQVETDNLHIFRSGGTTLAWFRQSYRTGGFESRGLKRLYLRQNSDEWKIIGEFFKEEKIKVAAVKKKRPASENQIRDLIHQWRRAWETKDIRKYIACYDSKFESRGMDLTAWRKHRQWLNKKHRSLKIDISALKIVKGSGKSATAVFKQKYRADRYRDVGIKKLVLVKRGDRWKIRKENWTPLEKKSHR